MYVVDLDGSSLKPIDKKRYGEGNPVYVQFGEFIGTTKTDGTDREQRDRARSVYETYIDRSPVPKAKDVWKGIDNRWGAATDQVIVIDAATGHEIDGSIRGARAPPLPHPQGGKRRDERHCTDPSIGEHRCSG